MVQLYDSDSVASSAPTPTPRLNEVWEFVGVLSIDPALSDHRAAAAAAAAGAGAGAAAASGTGPNATGAGATSTSTGATTTSATELQGAMQALTLESMLEPAEELARNPPASLVPRLHCICALLFVCFGLLCGRFVLFVVSCFAVVLRAAGGGGQNASVRECGGCVGVVCLVVCLVTAT